MIINKTETILFSDKNVQLDIVKVFLNNNLNKAHYCITDGYCTDWIIFYGNNRGWAHDGVFNELTPEIIEFLNDYSRGL